jgi:hypothetical protein
MYIDVLVDGIGKIVLDKIYTGWLGKPKSTQTYPFLYRQDGYGNFGVDFGSSPDMDQDGRLVNFPLASIKICHGALVDFYNSNEDEDWPPELNLSIRQAVDLLTGQLVEL